MVKSGWSCLGQTPEVPAHPVILRKAQQRDPNLPNTLLGSICQAPARGWGVVGKWRGLQDAAEPGNIPQQVGGQSFPACSLVKAPGSTDKCLLALQGGLRDPPHFGGVTARHWPALAQLLPARRLPAQPFTKPGVPPAPCCPAPTRQAPPGPAFHQARRPSCSLLPSSYPPGASRPSLSPSPASLLLPAAQLLPARRLPAQPFTKPGVPPAPCCPAPTRQAPPGPAFHQARRPSCSLLPSSYPPGASRPSLSPSPASLLLPAAQLLPARRLPAQPFTKPGVPPAPCCPAPTRQAPPGPAFHQARRPSCSLLPSSYPPGASRPSLSPSPASLLLPAAQLLPARRLPAQPFTKPGVPPAPCCPAPTRQAPPGPAFHQARRPSCSLLPSSYPPGASRPSLSPSPASLLLPAAQLLPARRLPAQPFTKPGVPPAPCCPAPTRQAPPGPAFHQARRPSCSLLPSSYPPGASRPSLSPSPASLLLPAAQLLPARRLPAQPFTK
uniref:Uncharacterized protein n=1 Tax=Pelodiscus sinensis TaxID=13735 RepID=K7EY53_PELSI